MKTLIEILILAAFGAFAFIMFLMAGGKAKQKRYLEKIIYLEAFVQTVPVNNENFEIIYSEFVDLWEIDCDTERTKDLFKVFTKRYRNEWLNVTVVKKDNPEYMEFFNKILA